MTTTEFDDYLKRLRRDLCRLESSKVDESKRKRTRAGVLASLRLLRAAVDRDYPAVITRKKTTRLKTFEGKLARAQAAGWRSIDRIELGLFVAERVRVKRVSGPVRSGAGTNYCYMVPAWAVAAKVSGIVELRRAVRDPSVRKAALAAMAL